MDYPYCRQSVLCYPPCLSRQADLSMRCFVGTMISHMGPCIWEVLADRYKTWTSLGGHSKLYKAQNRSWRAKLSLLPILPKVPCEDWLFRVHSCLESHSPGHFPHSLQLSSLCSHYAYGRRLSFPPPWLIQVMQSHRSACWWRRVYLDT